LSEFPNMIGAWSEESSTQFDQDTLKVLGVDDYINRNYSESPKKTIGLYIGYYLSQRQGDTIHSPMNCLPGAGWNPIRKEYLKIPVAESASTAAHEIAINRIIIQKGLDVQVVLYWYQSHGRVIANEYWSKIYTVFDAMRTNRTDAALVRVISPVRGSEESFIRKSEEDATDFVKNLFPILDEYLPN
jgi:EpsI family protein